MKRLPPAKRNQLIGVVAATAVTLFRVFYFLIDPQKEQNRKLGEKIRTENDKLKSIKTSIRESERISNDLANVAFQLDRAEADVASGDVYAWTYETIRHFKSTYHVDIPSLSSPEIKDSELLASFPYRQVKVTLSGTGFYHDIGKFLADFENNYPHMRVCNLTIEPANTPGTPERLNFRVDVVALIKPNS